MLPDVLQIFAKAPLPGAVKTRLAVDIGEVQACAVYLSLLTRTAANTQSSQRDTELWCSPDKHHPELQRLALENNLTLTNQCDGDIGERMLYALKEGLKEHQKVVLIGSDCPVISAGYINQAFDALDESDVVFGPVEDGGYVLIGCRQLHGALFNDVEWSSINTLKQNIQAVERCGLRYALLADLWDVDDVVGYERLLDSDVEVI